MTGKPNARYEHNKRVIEFLREARQKDPTKYKEVLKKYPIVNSKKWKLINELETPFCELGELH